MELKHGYSVKVFNPDLLPNCGRQPVYLSIANSSYVWWIGALHVGVFLLILWQAHIQRHTVQRKRCPNKIWGEHASTSILILKTLSLCQKEVLTTIFENTAWWRKNCLGHKMESWSNHKLLFWPLYMFLVMFLWNLEVFQNLWTCRKRVHSAKQF